jgi:hypothetical protein
LGTFWLKIKQFWPFELYQHNVELFNMYEFELHKHNDELFNMYYGIFSEILTFADFDRLCKIERGG